MNDSLKLVSVGVITYNQEKTIGQTLDSILSQQCNFSFEIVIGEDCSTDKTREICKSYQQQYPDKVKLLLQQNNKGLIRNFADVMNNCQNPIVALCAGDDYWCDNYKLQKQIDFLTENSGFGFVRTGFKILEEKTAKFKKGTGYSNITGSVFEVAKYGPVAAASTICFRRDLLDYIDFNEFERRKFSMEDYPMQAILARHTKFGYIPDITTVYRHNSSSISRPITREKILQYNEGYAQVKMFLSEKYPEALYFSHQMKENYLNHKKLQFAFEDFSFQKAKEISRLFIQPNPKESRLASFCNNRVVFYLAALYRKILRII